MMQLRITVKQLLEVLIFIKLDILLTMIRHNSLYTFLNVGKLEDGL
jgi:hypothetical protein